MRIILYRVVQQWTEMRIPDARGKSLGQWLPEFYEEQERALVGRDTPWQNCSGSDGTVRYHDPFVIDKQQLALSGDIQDRSRSSPIVLFQEAGGVLEKIDQTGQGVPTNSQGG